MGLYTCTAVAVLALVVGGGIERLLEAPKLASEKLAHAKDNEQHVRTLKAVVDRELGRKQNAMLEKALTQKRLEALDVALTKERQARENIDLHYRNLISAGRERLYVPVRKHKPSLNAGASGASGMGNGASTIADIDPAAAKRIFEVARDDEIEIEKLRALQGYICAIRRDAPNCESLSKQGTGRKERVSP